MPWGGIPVWPATVVEVVELVVELDELDDDDWSGRVVSGRGCCMIVVKSVPVMSRTVPASRLLSSTRSAPLVRCRSSSDAPGWLSDEYRIWVRARGGPGLVSVPS